MIQAVQTLVTKARDGEDIVIDEQAIKDHLYTRDLPSVDLIIRTGDDPHLSAGFMMWDAADAELYFSDLLWPDFSLKHFDEALDSYAARRRRRGT